MRILVGSAAAQVWGIHLGRDPRDRDYLTTEPDEVLGPEDYYHPRFAEITSGPTTFRDFSTGTAVARPELLLALKLSHTPWDLRNGSWWKHVKDIELLEQKTTLSRTSKAITSIRDALYPVWEERYGKKKVDLNKDRAEFFSDHVRRVWDHDSIHETISHPARPLYEEFLGGEVAMDMGKVRQAPLWKQRELFLEEVLATALERWLIPSDYRCSPMGAYRNALKLTVTSLTKGWSTWFMVNNLDYYLPSPPHPYYLQHHLNNRHLLRPFRGKGTQ